MSLLKIYTYPDTVLKQKAIKVTDFDAELEELVNDMFDTMYDAPGVGLAANQVGVLKRVLVIDVDYSIEGEDDEIRRYINKTPRVFINPVILEAKQDTSFKEGCLSVPGFTEEVKRKKLVKVEFQDLTGATHTIDADGLLSIALQHEIDHLEGRLFIDRLSVTKKSLIKGKIKKDRNSKFERSKFHVEL